MKGWKVAGLLLGLSFCSVCNAKDIVFAIGISSYKDEFWPPLKFPTTDAQQFSRQVGDGSGTAKEVSILTNQRASLAEIRKKMKEIEQSSSSKDNLIVYISGHGSLAVGRSGDLEQVVVVHDTTQDALWSTSLTHDELRRWINRVPARRKVLILATCHSGIGKSRLPTRAQELLAGNKGKMHELDDVSESVLVMAAAAKGETAREDSCLNGDIYTHYFIEGLKAGDRNQDGAVTALEAHDFARNRTFAFTKGKQRPTLEALSIGTDDVVLSGRQVNKGSPVLNAYGSGFAGILIQTEKGPRQALPTGIPLKTGKNRIDLFNEGTEKPIASFSVAAKPGESLTLENLFAPAPYRAQVALVFRQWDDTKFRRAVGNESRNSNGNGVRVGLGYVMKRVHLELAAFSGIFSDTQPIPGVDFKVTNNYLAISTSYLVTRLNGFEWSLGVGVQREQLNIKFVDRATQAEIPLNGVAYPLFVRSGIGWAWNILTANASVTREMGAFNLNEETRISANKTSVELGLTLSFGGSTRRIR